MRTAAAVWVLAALAVLGAQAGNSSLAEKYARLSEGEFVVSLDTESFLQLTEQGTWFVKFFSPYCIHCQRLAPTWNQLAEQFMESAEQTVVAEVDCTAQENRKLAKLHQIQSYPTIKLFHSGKVYPYKGERTLKALSNFAKEGWQAESGDQRPDQEYLGVQHKNLVESDKVPQLKTIVESSSQNAMSSMQVGIILVFSAFIIIGFFVCQKSKELSKRQ